MPASFKAPEKARAARAETNEPSIETLNFFTIADVADMLRISSRSVRRLIDDHNLRAHHFGRAVRIADSDLRQFLRKFRN
jgi:excisionase family DNA binding protein